MKLRTLEWIVIILGLLYLGGSYGLYLWHGDIDKFFQQNLVIGGIIVFTGLIFGLVREVRRDFEDYKHIHKSEHDQESNLITHIEDKVQDLIYETEGGDDETTNTKEGI